MKKIMLVGFIGLSLSGCDWTSLSAKDEDRPSFQTGTGDIVVNQVSVDGQNNQGELDLSENNELK